jgi:cytidyltransferase-like protein
MSKLRVVVSGSFDDLRSHHVRFLEEAAGFGEVHALVLSDRAHGTIAGAAPKFPEEERLYLLDSIKYVDSVSLVHHSPGPDALAQNETPKPAVWVVRESEISEKKKDWAAQSGIRLEAVPEERLHRFPEVSSRPAIIPSSRPKVVVTGCYDWFHSGHVRFFEEVSQHGDLYAIVGHDANIRLLKGEGHPLLPQQERWYLVQAVRHVTQALLTSGEGWMDAAPEIEWIQPDIYAVNEDGDRPEKREFSQLHGLQYLVLRRTPRAGLPRRQSTDLRGF